jgi:hypothetical protein
MISCSAYTRLPHQPQDKGNRLIDNILYYASLAASSHNTQPWKVKVIGNDSLVIYPDVSRKLPVIDSTSRELFISLGAFIENMEIAANNFGYKATFNICKPDTANTDNTYVTVSLQKQMTHNTFNTNHIEQRRVLRGDFDTEPIAKADIAQLISEAPDNIRYIPATSADGTFIGQKTIEAYAQQAYNPKAQAEMAKWLRFSNKDAKSQNDGLTTSGMEIRGIAAWVVRSFFKPSDSKKETFISNGIKRTKQQVLNSTGWLVVFQNEESPAKWIATGRIIQRLNMRCCTLSIGFQPMSQIIEEAPFEQQLNDQIKYPGAILFVARIGYVKAYPKAISVRRPVNSFTTYTSQ